MKTYQVFLQSQEEWEDDEEYICSVKATVSAESKESALSLVYEWLSYKLSQPLNDVITEQVMEDVDLADEKIKIEFYWR